MIATNERTVYIYTLTEEGSDDVRYVGQTVNPKNRLISHLDTSRMAESNPKRIWVDDVLSRGSNLVINIVENTTMSEARDREQHWIDHYTAAGAVLTNSQNAMHNPTHGGNPRLSVGTKVYFTVYVDNDRLDKWLRIKDFTGTDGNSEVMEMLIDEKFERLEEYPDGDSVDLVKRVKELESWKKDFECGNSGEIGMAIKILAEMLSEKLRTLPKGSKKKYMKKALNSILECEGWLSLSRKW